MSHGPSMHGPLITLLLIIALVGGLVYGLVHLVKIRTGRHVDRDPTATAESDRGPEA